ncbi:hypothetical protein ACX3YG_23260 [Pseudomonas wadenswilerensis]
MAKRVLVDTGFWIALFHERDRYHELAQIMEEGLEFHQLLIPWPTLFEFVGTRLVRRRSTLAGFRQMLNKTSIVLVDDEPYREKSLEFTTGPSNHSYSLTDHVLRSMIEDVNLSVDALISFNPEDFRDVCAKRRIEIHSGD